MKSRPPAVNHEEGFGRALKMYRPSTTLEIFVWLPIWLGALWTTISLFISLNIGQAMSMGGLLTIILCGATMLISGHLRSVGDISQRYGGFNLYRSYWERNVRGFVLASPVPEHNYGETDDSLLTIYVFPRHTKLEIQTPKHVIWVSLGGWGPKSGGLLYIGFERNSPSMWFRFDSLDSSVIKVRLVQSNGSRVTIPLHQALRLAQADADTVSSGLPRDPSTIEGVIARMFRPSEEAVVER